MKVNTLSQAEYDKYIEWRRAYNALPEVKMKNRAYMQKYLAKPGIRERIRRYSRAYMQAYWQDKEKYAKHVMRVKAGALVRRKAAMQARGAAIQQKPTKQTSTQPTKPVQQYQRR